MAVIIFCASILLVQGIFLVGCHCKSPCNQSENGCIFFVSPWGIPLHTLKVLNFAGIKFRDFAIFSLNREIKYQGETLQVYNREIIYPRNLISGGF